MLSFYTFATRKPALPRSLPDFIGRLLVIRAGKPNVCFADACFSFAHMLFTRKPVLPHSLPDFIGRLLVIRAGKPNVCFADACFSFARIHCNIMGGISLPKNCFLPLIMRFHAIRRISFPVRNKHLLHAFCNNAYPVIPAAQAECGH